MKTRKEAIMNEIDSIVANFLYYDRKNDEDLPANMIQEAIRDEEITVSEIVREFKRLLIAGLKE